MEKNSKLPVIVLGVIIAACLIIFLLMNKGGSDDAEDTTAAFTEEYSDSEQGEQEEESEEAEDDQAEADSYDSGTSEVAYTQNDYPDTSACLTPDAFEVYYADTFSFGYPKYIFNNAYINESEGVYEFWYDDDYRLTITETAAEYNAKKSAHEIYEQLLTNYSYIYFQRDVKDLDDHDMCRALVGGYYPETGQGEYNIVASDGETTYQLTVTYPDTNPEDEYKEVNYIVDCIYRFCSFGGGTYQPRTWDQFLVDDMGEKK